MRISGKRSTFISIQQLYMVKQQLKQSITNRLRSFELPHSAVLWVDADVSKKYGDSFFRGKKLCPSDRIQFWRQNARNETKSEPISQDTTYTPVKVSWNTAISQQWTRFTGSLVPPSIDNFISKLLPMFPAVPCDLRRSKSVCCVHTRMNKARYEHALLSSPFGCTLLTVQSKNAHKQVLQ